MPPPSSSRIVVVILVIHCGVWGADGAVVGVVLHLVPEAVRQPLGRKLGRVGHPGVDGRSPLGGVIASWGRRAPSDASVGSLCSHPTVVAKLWLWEG
jgi:hypothetical protein